MTGSSRLGVTAGFHERNGWQWSTRALVFCFAIASGAIVADVYAQDVAGPDLFNRPFAPLENPVVPIEPAPGPNPPLASPDEPFYSAPIQRNRASSSFGGPAGAGGVTQALAAGSPTTIAAGRLDGQFAVTQAGASSYTIPIWTPPGVGDLQLSLALQYSSRAMNGVLGVGWSMTGLSSISRCQKTWAQDGIASPVTNTLSDRFCLDGQQLKLVGGTYGQSSSVYATEVESFSKIVAAGATGSGPSSFAVTSKNGLIYDYGLTSNARIMAGASGTVRIWALSRIRDRVGNRIDITYTVDAANGSYRVASIRYPTTATGQGPFYEVLFTYSLRPSADNPSGYLAGNLSREQYQLDRIAIQNVGAAVVTKAYYLSYELASTSSRIRLAAVEECSATSCYPPTTVAYQNGARGWSTTLTTSPIAGMTAGPIPVDLNGDGIGDLLYATSPSGSTRRWWVAFGAPTGFFSVVDTGLTTGVQLVFRIGDLNGDGKDDVAYLVGTSLHMLTATGSSVSTQSAGASDVQSLGALTDMDGDGLADLLYVPINGSFLSLYSRRNTSVAGQSVSFGPSTIAWTSGTYLVTPLVGGPTASTGIQVADFNGDGRADIALRVSTVSGGLPPINIYYTMMLISTGTAYVEATGFQNPIPPNSGYLLADWNADGLTDLLTPVAGPSAATWQVRPARGDGSFAPAFDTGASASAGAVLVSDWDGDGRSDLLSNQAGTWFVRRSTGLGAAAAVSTGIAAPVSTSWFVADLDGDGLDDLAYVDAADGARIKYRLRAEIATPPDLATSFTDGFGMAQNPTYASIARGNYYAVGSPTYPSAVYRGPLYVVNQFTASDGTGSTYQNQFWYYDAQVNLQGRGFQGFEAQRIYDTRNSVYTYDYVQREFPHTGRVQARLVETSSSSFLSYFLTEPGVTTLGSGFERRYFPYDSATSDYRYEFGGSLHGQNTTLTSTTYAYADGYGNPTQIQRTVEDRDTTSPFYGQTWSTTQSISYMNAPGPNCLGLPTNRTETRTAPGQTAQTRTEATLVDSTYCRPWRQTLEPSTPLQVQTSLGYDGCGNVNSVQIAGSYSSGAAMPARVTSFNYGARCQLPESLTNPLGHATALQYRFDLGLVTRITDANGLATTLSYDAYGRPTLERRPDGTSTEWYRQYCVAPSCWGVVDVRFLLHEWQFDANTAPIFKRYYFFDGFERLRYDEYDRAFGVWTNRVYVYDSLGRRTHEYNPYSSTSTGYTRSTYDVLDRPTAINTFQPSGVVHAATAISYAGRTVRVTDPLNRTSTRVSDVLGQLRRVSDPAPGGTTSYTYDAFGNLNRVQDAIGAVSTGQYNRRDFRTQWNDADSGLWTYTPNSLNELTAWTDAKGQAFSAAYDKLGRLEARTEPEGTSYWTWGVSAAQRNIGKLASVFGGGHNDIYEYDASGRVARRKLVTEGEVFNYDYTYTPQGLLDTIAYPNSPIPSGQSGARFTIRYGYSYGVPTSIHDITSGNALIWQLNAANDFGQATAERLGTSTATTVATTYRAWTGEVAAIQSGVASTNNRQNLAYSWDAAGNLTQRRDLSQSLTETFTLDALDRVQGASLNGTSTLSLNFNAAGDITYRSDVGSYGYSDPAHRHAVTTAGGNTLGYDANGNVTTRNGLTQTWTSYNLPSVLRVASGGNTYQSQFFYGAERDRWKQIASYPGATETTWYIGDRLERVHSTATGVTRWRHYVPTPSGLTAVVSRNTDGTTSTSYALGDHLGSTDTVLDQAGSIRYRASFASLGARRGSAWIDAPSGADSTAIAASTRRGFTFHEHLDNLGLIHMNGRVYDPQIGRFMSVDPLIGNLADSQSVNAYSYVGNRPLTYTDPYGYEAVSTCAAVCANVVKFVVNTVVGALIGRLGSLFGGSSPPPPPPARALPGITAQSGFGACGPGTTTPACSGNVLYSQQPNTGPSPNDRSMSGPYIILAGELVITVIPGVSQAYAVYELIVVLRDPNATATDIVLSSVAILPAGRVLKVGDNVLRSVAAKSGGTYILRDRVTGQVRRTGRSGDLETRRGQHARDPAMKDLDFEIDRRTNSYPEQRGREQVIYDQNPGADLNRIRPISPTNPRLREYLEAGRSLGGG